MLGNKVDVIVSFDTTGSMYPVLAQVRREVKSFVKTLFDEFSDLRLGIIAHGDYCDKDNPYTIRIAGLTRDVDGLCDFVTNTEQTYGGDFDECYELVLDVADSEFANKGRKDADKLLIMIGDATPHGVSYPENVERLDWKERASALASQDVKIFAVHALPNYRRMSKSFYETLADTTNGVYLTLNQFDEIVDLIKATCYQQFGEEKLNEYVTYVELHGRMTNSMSNNFKRLKGEKVEDDYTSSRYSRSSKPSADVRIKDVADLVPVLEGRFQTMIVDKDTPIKEFVEYNGITFKKGRGFYELTKAETVQQYKEVIIQDRVTGEMFTGAQVRERLGLKPQSEKGGVNEKLHKADAEKFRVFVQSTSVNRKLIKGTRFLYEIDDLDVKETKGVSDTVEKEIEDMSKKSIKKSETKKSKSVKKDSVKKSDIPTLTEETASTVLEKAVFKAGKKLSESTPKKTRSVKKDPLVPASIKEVGISADVISYKKPTVKSVVEEAPKVDIESVKAEASDKVSDVIEAVSVQKALEDYVKTNEFGSKVVKSMSKVYDGLNRCVESTNKKNKAFLINNLRKLAKEAEALADSLE